MIAGHTTPVYLQHRPIPDSGNIAEERIERLEEPKDHDVHD